MKPARNALISGAFRAVLEGETDLSANNKRFVFPGDVLATSEEAVPGPGAHDDGSNIVATRLGNFHLDTNEMKAIVEPLTTVPTQMHLGDFIIGEVTMVKPSMCAVEVLAVEGKTRVVVGDTNGTLHVSKIARRYVKDVGNEYRLGDVIRAQIISVKPSVQLSTEETQCGAIKALCTRCRFGLNKVAKALECPNCGRREMRNLAPDYGEVRLPSGFATLNNDA